MDTQTIRELDLFEAAVLVEEEERGAFLDKACGDDAELRSRIVRLLQRHSESDRFFSECQAGFAPCVAERSTAGSSTAESITDERSITRVGRYRLIRELGEGGCGVVYLAEQEEPVRRYVAVKIIKLGMDTRSVKARFEAERQALALMDHPNIARVLDAGATETGRLYFVMDFVDGVKIVQYCDERNLDNRQRLNLFILVCNAIQHAHQKGIIHRDIKPSNVLVANTDGQPVPKVIDFGIAKATENSLTENTLTLQGQLVGTPAYMSPEQAEFGAADIDTRTDIYSLGVLLYELLTGRTPFEQKALMSSGIFEMRRTLLEKEPPSPSTLLTSLGKTDLSLTARHRHVEPPRLVKSLQGDLDWIVMKALEKDRRRRYATVNGLAADVQRYLNNEAVAARPPSQFYRLSKLIQRNKALWAAGTLAVILLLLGLGLSIRLAFIERKARMEQARLHQWAEGARLEAERARANEMQLRKEAEAREKVTQATVLIGHDEMEKADALLDPVPPDLFAPSTEAATVFRELGTWNILRGRWEQAANRYLVLVRVNQVDKELLRSDATFDLLIAAPLLIQTGDIEGYDRLRHESFAKFGNTPYSDAAEQLLKISLLIPADEKMMKSLAPVASRMADSLETYSPAEKGNWYLASWRALALGLWEYRSGRFNSVQDWLKKSSSYPDQSQSCAAAVHLLGSMTLYKLNQKQAAEKDLAIGTELVKDYFNKQLQKGDDKTGRLGGWIMNMIFLHEAEHLILNKDSTSISAVFNPESSQE